MARRQLRSDEDEEADEGAVVATERQRDGDAVDSELGARRDDGVPAGLGLTYEPAGQRGRGRPVRPRLGGERPAQTVLVPVDQPGPCLVPGTRRGRNDPAEE